MHIPFNKMSAYDISTLAGNIVNTINEMATQKPSRDPKGNHGWAVRVVGGPVAKSEKDPVVLSVELGNSTFSPSWLNLEHTASFEISIRRDPKNPSRALIEVANKGDGFLDLDNSVTSKNMPSHMKETYTTHLTGTPGEFKKDLLNFMNLQERTGRITSIFGMGRMSVDEVDAVTEDKHPTANYVKAQSAFRPK